jgi:hypothetical protein
VSENLGKLEFPENGCQRRGKTHQVAVGYLGDPQRDARKRDREHANEQRTFDLTYQQRTGDQHPAHHQQHRSGLHFPQTDQSRVVAHDQSRVFLTNKGDKKTDTSGNRVFHRKGNGIQNRFTNIQGREKQE